MATRREPGAVSPLWVEKAQAGPGPKPALTVERIARAAIRVADADGLAAVSMQRVAGEFGFTTMSLYRYVPGKTELVDLMVDTALGDPPALEEISGGWRPKLEDWARRLWVIFHRHRWALEASARARPMGPNELGWLEAAVEALTGTGLTGGELVDAAAVVQGHVRSMALHSTAMGQAERTTGEQWGATMADVLHRHGERYPALMAAVAAGAFGPSDNDGFEFGLQCVLDGLAVRIAQRAR